MHRNIMTVLLFNFLIAVAVTLAASAVIAFILTNVVVGWIKGSLYRDVLRNFWSKNRKDILIVALGAMSAFLVAKYKPPWLVF
jgi:NhaP-type Na+/H+ or K+/H+ antiporter